MIRMTTGDAWQVGCRERLAEGFGDAEFLERCGLQYWQGIFDLLE